MLARSRPKLRQVEVSANLLLCRAEDLPFQSQSFDTVVATLVLCSVSDPARSLKEIARVLKRGGRFLFLEHTRAQGDAAKWQDRLTPVWSRLALGCHLNRSTVSSIQQAGFHLARLERHLPPGLPRLAQPAFIGVALNETSHPFQREARDRFDNIEAQGGPR
jgi:SAM-dependent methyltransferase